MKLFILFTLLVVICAALAVAVSSPDPNPADESIGSYEESIPIANDLVNALVDFLFGGAEEEL